MRARSLSLGAITEMGYTGAGCCGLGAMADDSGYDCVMIPAPSNEGPMAMIKDRYHLSGFLPLSLP